MRVRDPLVQISAGLWMMARTWGCNVYIVGEGRPSLIAAGFPLEVSGLTMSSSVVFIICSNGAAGATVSA